MKTTDVDSTPDGKNNSTTLLLHFTAGSKHKSSPRNGAGMNALFHAFSRPAMGWLQKRYYAEGQLEDNGYYGSRSGIMNTSQVLNILNSIAPGSITEVTLTGHGSSSLIQLAEGSFFTAGRTGCRPAILDEAGTDVTETFRRALSPNAQMKLRGCHTATGDFSIAEEFSDALGIPVQGYPNFGFYLLDCSLGSP